MAYEDDFVDEAAPPEAVPIPAAKPTVPASTAAPGGVPSLKPPPGGLDEIAKAYAGQIADSQKLVADERAAIDSRTQRTQEVLGEARSSRPKAPDLAMPPPPPEKPPETGPLEAFGSAASVLGIIGAFLTRRPLTTALNASASAMDALRVKDQQGFENAIREWKVNADYVNEANRVQQSRYDAAMKAHEGDVNLQLAAIKAEAAASQDRLVLQNVARGNLQDLTSLFQLRRQAVNDFNDNAIKLQELADKALGRNPEAVAFNNWLRQNPNATPEQQAAALKFFNDASANVKSSATERLQASEAAQLREAGMTEQEITDLQMGRLQVVVNPVTDEVTLVNKAAAMRGDPNAARVLSGGGLTREARGKMADQNEAISRVQDNIDEISDSLEKTIGAKAVVKDTMSKGLGQLPTAEFNVPYLGKVGTGDKAVDPEVTRGREKIRILREEILPAMMKNARMPVDEQKRLLGLLPSDGVFESAPRAREVFAQIEDSLMNIYNANNRALGKTPRIQNDEDWEALRWGEDYINPNGKMSTKKRPQEAKK